jgi:hypothetical protein
VPELSRFFGIVIRMFAEVGAEHHVPHFHAYYQEEVGIYSIDPVEMIAGSLPRRQKRLVEVGRIASERIDGRLGHFATR